MIIIVVMKKIREVITKKRGCEMVEHKISLWEPQSQKECDKSGECDFCLFNFHSTKQSLEKKEQLEVGGKSCYGASQIVFLRALESYDKKREG